ncbi:MAG: hypothetical protein OEY59_11435 [Deltaproteobacteria bacterium]|nr:hypothetical protein [Deltaproteobacteria bacterium]
MINKASQAHTDGIMPMKAHNYNSQSSKVINRARMKFENLLKEHQESSGNQGGKTEGTEWFLRQFPWIA